MNYRFVKVTSFYRSFLEYYYPKKRDIIAESYEVQLQDILNEGFGWADFFKTNMNKLGNEAHEIIWNTNHIQRKWAEENNLKLSGSDILHHQLKKLNPEVIFFQDSLSFPAGFIKKIRSTIPSVKLIIGWLCSPHSKMHLETLREFDFVCACSPEFTGYLTNQGIKNYELNHAFESSILNKVIVPSEKDTDLMFAGSFVGSSDFHSERIKLIESLLKSGVKINIYTGYRNIPWFKLKGMQGTYILAGLLEKAGLEKMFTGIPVLKKTASLSEMPGNLKLSETFMNSLKSAVYGYDMFREICKARIGLNTHGGVAGDYAANSRMFEITGVGSLLITDMKRNISELFKPDEEVLVYNSAEECSEKIKWALENKAESARIAAAGQKRTLLEHTFKNRVEKLNEIIINHLA